VGDNVVQTLAQVDVPDVAFLVGMVFSVMPEPEPQPKSRSNGTRSSTTYRRCIVQRPFLVLQAKST
jgi:hypothetical protein